VDYQRRLAAVHDAVARAAVAHQAAAEHHAAANIIPAWGCAEKRRLVDLSEVAADGHLRGMIGVASQPFGEIVNQLATVERLLYALRWAEENGAERVLECNSTTSRPSAAVCSHDLVVAGSDTTMVFEVSDVAGNDGNANGKMTKDLFTLARCTCAAGSTARRLLAVSAGSGRWLETHRPDSVSVCRRG
jgi:hypothetical protein